MKICVTTRNHSTQLNGTVGLVHTNAINIAKNNRIKSLSRYFSAIFKRDKYANVLLFFAQTF